MTLPCVLLLTSPSLPLSFLASRLLTLVLGPCSFLMHPGFLLYSPGRSWLLEDFIFLSFPESLTV